jgi:hypothetical protein
MLHIEMASNGSTTAAVQAVQQQGNIQPKGNATRVKSIVPRLIMYGLSDIDEKFSPKLDFWPSRVDSEDDSRLIPSAARTIISQNLQQTRLSITPITRYAL